MLARELLPLVKNVTRVLDISAGKVDLRRHLRVPEEMAYATAGPAEVTGTAVTPDTLLVCLVGPQDGTHTPPGDLSPALRALPAGAKVLVLVGWPPEAFPADLVLQPLADGRCQVTEVVPVDPADPPGLHMALVAERVDELPPASDALPVRLTAANQQLLAEVVAQLTRQRLRELDDRVAELEAESAATHQDTAALRAELAARDKALAKARRRVRNLESSSTYRVGQAFVDGARHPAKAVVTVPMNLAKIWRARRTRAAAPPAPAPRPTHRTVSIPVPSSPQRTLTLTAPANLLVPRELDKAGLTGYETSAVPCFLAALDTAGPGAVLDIGANIGLYAALAAAVTDREVVAFEPFPTLSEVAERFSADNDLGFRVESIALGRENTTATLYLSDRSDSSNSLAAGFRKSTRQIEVPVETLDGYVRRTGAVPAVLKIDTESTEPDVLFGASETLRDHRPWVLCEVLAGRVEERLTEALAPHGYHWYPITNEVPYQRASVIEGDRTYQHLMWLFAPEAPDEAFWAAVSAKRAAIAAAEPDRAPGGPAA
jgi:FkbM family methyltransferase